jgi:hypothetical protein
MKDGPYIGHAGQSFLQLEWDLMLLGFGLQALSSAISDHCPIIMCQQAEEEGSVPR